MGRQLKLAQVESEILQYSSSAVFPQPTGSIKYLYLDQLASTLYRWDASTSQYVLLNNPTAPPTSGSAEGELYFADLATSARLAPNTYNNGTSGSGATLTGTGLGVVGQFNQTGLIDNTTPLSSDIILVKNEQTASRNGLYSITNLGSPSSSYVLTRVPYYDTGSEMYPSQITVLRGTTGVNRTFIQQTDNPTVGSSSIVFSQSPSTGTQIIPILFMDTVTTGPLPSSSYATGSSYIGFPGYQATITANTTGSLGVIGGITASSGIRILVVSQSNSVQNGSYTVTSPGSPTTPWKLTRIDYWTSMQPNNKEFVISRFGATEYGSRYVLQSSSITDANIGISQSLIFQKYLYLTSGSGGTTPTFPYTGSATITGSLIVTGSIVATTGFTGSLLGTAATASFVVTAQTASYVLNAQTASYVVTAQTASYILNAVSSSFATTASYALNALSASWAPSISPFPFTGSAIITGSMILTGSLQVAVPSTAGAASELARFKPTDNSGYLQIINYSTTAGAFTPTIRTVHNTTSTSTGLQFIAQIGTDSAINNNPAMTFLVMSQSSAAGPIRNRPLFTWENNNTSLMALTTVGLAIGTNLLRPSASLHVNNTSSFNSFLVEDDTTPDSSPFVIDNVGRVGIGTTTPSASIDVKASSSAATDTVFRITNAANTSSILSIAGNGAFIYNANTGSITFTEGTSGGVGQKFILQRSTYSASFTIGNNGGTTLATDGLNITSNGSVIELNGGPSGGSFFQSVDLKGNSNLSARVNSSGQFAFTSDTSWYNGANGFTYTGDKVIIDGHTMAFRSASVAPTSTLDTFKLYSADIVAGNAAPHFHTEAGNIIKLYTQPAVTSAQGIADALTNLGLLTGSSVIATGSTPGPVGIANSSGSYTYYTSFSSSMAAATSGQTVEFFADIIETGSISVNLKDNVNINGNGHTYTLNSTSSANCIQDNGVAVNCSISNITFKRINTSLSGQTSTSKLCMYVTGASIIKAYGTKLIGTQQGSGLTQTAPLTINNLAAQVFGIYAEGYNPCITVTNGQLFDSTAKSLAGTGIIVEASGTAIKCVSYGYGSDGLVSAGNIIDCVGYGSVNNGITATAGLVQNCTGYGGGGFGLSIGGANTVAINSTGYSPSTGGVYTNSIRAIGLKGYSTSGRGIYLINGVLTDCIGYSTANQGIYMENSGATISELRSCKAISTAAAAIYQNNLTTGSKIYNTEAISRWNNVLGHGIIVSGNNTEIVQCIIETTNATANCISGSSALTAKYANNAFKGATVAVTPNITQGIINTHDNQGNIII